MLSITSKLGQIKISLLDLVFLIGNTLEHFNNYLYNFLIIIIAPKFFPSYSFVIQVMLAYSVTITSTITKPFGAIVFGALATHKGPFIALIYASYGAAICTFFTGCVPTARSSIAAIILIIVRISYGIFAGGCRSIIRLYLIENYSLINQNNKNLIQSIKISYFYEISSMLGIILASLISYIIIKFNGLDLWRSCFWISGSGSFLLAIIYYSIYKFNNPYSSNNINNEDFLENKKSYLDDIGCYNKTKKLLKIILAHKAIIIKIALVSATNYITYAIPFIFFNNFIPIILGNIQVSEISMINNCLLVFDLIILFVISNIIDYYNFIVDKVLLFSASVLAITIIPMFKMLINGSILTVIFVSLWIIIFGSIFTGSIGCWYKMLLNNVKERYFLLAIGDALGSNLIGKSSISCCFYLWYLSNNILIPAFFLASLILLAIFAILVTISRKDFCWRSSVGRAADL